jgi:alginate O-acetyltransferase complex protein AlgI
MGLLDPGFFLLLLPLSLGLYYLVFRRARSKLWFLLGLSYLFYALAGLEFVPLLLGLSLMTFWLARRGWTGAGISLNLGALLLFKYLDFGLTNLNALFGAAHLAVVLPVFSLALPLGISFFVFKHIGYLIEVHNGHYPASNDFVTFATFSAFFPQISAGPISDYAKTAVQLTSLPKKLAQGQVYAGILSLSIGLAKKILIADALANVVNLQGSGIVWAWYVVVAFAMRLYFDFSGYSDIALGLGSLFGVALPPNFNNPYLATNPSAFWDRWHISLSTWFRYYLFFPLSRTLLKRWGSTRRNWAQYTANLVTMVLVGLWHGAGWGYVLWGGYHGILLNINAMLARRSFRPAVVWLGRGIFLLSLMFGWALFLSPTLSMAQNLIGNMLGLGGLGTFSSIGRLAINAATPELLLAIPLAFSGFAEADHILKFPVSKKAWFALTMGILAAMALLFMARNVTFIYVQF